MLNMLRRSFLLLLSLVMLLTSLALPALGETNINLPLTITTSDLTYPGTLTAGESFSLRGTVSVNYGTITKLNAVIKNRSNNKTVLNVNSWPKKKNASVRDTINRKVSFGKLSAGSYNLKITAYASYGSKSTSKVIINRNFTVKAEKPSITIRYTQYPTTVTQGSSASLRGVISVNKGTLTSVTAYIRDANGKNIMSAKYTPNKKSFDIRYTINKAFKFSALPKGTYTYIVHARAKSGNTEMSRTLIEQTFTVD